LQKGPFEIVKKGGINSYWVFLLPLFGGSYPVLALLASNIGEVNPSESLRAWIVLVLLAYSIFAIVWLIVRDTTQAAFISVILILILASYGHIYTLVKGLTIDGFIIGRHRFLLPVLLILILLLITWILKRSQDTSIIILFIGSFLLIALILPLVKITTHLIQQGRTNQARIEFQEPSGLHVADDGKRRDIYYIILDAYSRDDVLLDNYGYNNSDFLHNLEAMGFVIPENSNSNYTVTKLSLTSSLNMAYLNELGDLPSPGSNNTVWMNPLIKNNRVRRMLEEIGYSFVSMESGYTPTSIEDADYYLNVDNPIRSGLRIFADLNPFESMLVYQSIGRIINDGFLTVPKIFGDTFNAPYQAHRDRILNAFERLEQVHKIPEPIFVFVHILSPHPPYAFGPNGEPVQFEDSYTLKPGYVEHTTDKQGYLNQITFINTKLTEVVETILRESEIEPIIILQADHGDFATDRADKAKILNAYYLPDGGDTLLYPDITVVNTFRLIFNYYFDADLGLLEDQIYYSTVNNPYELRLIEE
jgi:hypothetical protein